MRFCSFPCKQRSFEESIVHKRHAGTLHQRAQCHFTAKGQLPGLFPEQELLDMLSYGCAAAAVTDCERAHVPSTLHPATREAA